MLKPPRALWFFILSIFFLSYPGFAQDQPLTATQETAYQQLITDLRVIGNAPEFETQKENVRRHWQIGKRLNEYWPSSANNFEKHDLLVRLQEDLGQERRFFAKVRRFARFYPGAPPELDLPWTYFELAMQIEDDKQREEILQTAFSQHWETRLFKREVRKLLSGGKEKPLPSLEAKPGIPGTYRIVKHENRLAYDLGFSIYRDLSPEETAQYKEGDLVTCETVCRVSPEAAAADLFTYRARNIKVIDGDTVWADLDLGFGLSTVRRMRLRGIDAPELITEAGPRSKAYLEKLLSLESSGLSRERKTVSEDSPLKTHDILIHAEKIDKYNRSLADIWTCSARNAQISADGTRTTRDECGDGAYVNRKLLEDGQAVRLEE